jgi:hypothetical protein
MIGEGIEGIIVQELHSPDAWTWRVRRLDSGLTAVILQGERRRVLTGMAAHRPTLP